MNKALSIFCKDSEHPHPPSIQELFVHAKQIKRQRAIASDNTPTIGYEGYINKPVSKETVQRCMAKFWEDLEKKTGVKKSFDKNGKIDFSGGN